MENWLSGVSDAEGYERFKLQLKDLLKNDKSIVLGNDIHAEIKEHGELEISCEGKQQEIKDEELCSFWNYVRDVGVVKEDEIPLEYRCFSNLLLAIMKKLEYVQAIIVSENGRSFSKQANAYQFIAE